MPEIFTLEDVQRRTRAGSLQSVMVDEFRDSEFLNLLRFKNIATAHDEFKRGTALPTPQRRGLHADFARTRSTSTLGTEALRIFGTKMGFDRFLDRTGNMDVVGETRQHSKAIRLMLEHELIYGDPEDDADPGQLMGLQFLAEHAMGHEADTSRSAGATPGGEPLSQRLFMDAIDDCHPAATMIVCGTQMRNILTTGSRDVNVAGHIGYTEDSMGRRLRNYDELPIVTPKRNHVNAKLLGFNEAAASGPATAGSLYIVAHSIDGGGFYPFVNGDPFVEADTGKAAAVKERDLEWYIGTNRPSPWAVIRIKHIANAPMVQ